MTVPRWIAAQLEEGTLGSNRIARLLSRGYEATASSRLSRPAALPYGVYTIGVGSAVLGGAGKTLVAIAYARALSDAGLRVAYVAHGYRAKPRTPQLCVGDEDVLEVGDDTIVAARELRSRGVGVWVSSDRDLTIREAAREADVLVLDSVLQTRPRPLDRSVLVLDGARPFGAGICPPCGDLKGPVERLLSLCDEVVVVRDVRGGGVSQDLLRRVDRFPLVRTAWLDVGRVRSGGSSVGIEAMASMRVGYASMLARPERGRETLRGRGIVPVCHWCGPDHGPLRSRDVREIRGLSRVHSLSTWLSATKCAAHFEGLDLGAPLAVIELTSRLDPRPSLVLGSPPCVRPNSSRS